MKIKVQKASNSFYWYAREISKEFEVQYITVEQKQKMFWVRSGDAYNTINFILESDAQITEE